MGPRYTHAAVGLHWAAAVLILFNLAFGLYLVDLPLSPQKLKYFSWHKWVGITVLGLSAARLAWRLAHPAPALPASVPGWERAAAHASHALLYLLFFAVPITGWLFSSAAGFPVVYLGVPALTLPDLVDKNKELADLLKAAHRWLNYGLASLVALHIAAAIKHHVLDADEVLARMLPFLEPPSRNEP